MQTTTGRPVLTELPTFAFAEWSGRELLNRESAPLWGGKAPPPAVGAYIDIAGPRAEVATVLGYFIDGDWLMLWCERHSDGKRGDLAGPEIRNG